MLFINDNIYIYYYYSLIIFVLTLAIQFLLIILEKECYAYVLYIHTCYLFELFLKFSKDTITYIFIHLPILYALHSK